MSVYTYGHASTTLYMWRSENNMWGSVLFFHHVGFLGSNWDNHAWQQASLPLGPVCRCSLIFCISVWFVQSIVSYFLKRINKLIFNHCKTNLPGKSHQCVLKLGTEAWQETDVYVISEHLPVRYCLIRKDKTVGRQHRNLVVPTVAWCKSSNRTHGCCEPSDEVQRPAWNIRPESNRKESPHSSLTDSSRE